MNKIFDLVSNQGIKITLSNRLEHALESEQVLSGLLNSQQDTDRALDIAQSLEDMHIVLGKIPKPNSVDIGLVQSSINLMITGTTTNAGEVIASLENYSTDKIFLKDLLNRTSLILSTFLSNIGNTFFSTSKFARSILANLRDNKNLLDDLNKKFPIPDNPQDDINRTITFKINDSTFLYNENRLITSFSDLLNSFIKTTVEVNKITEVSKVINTKLSNSIRESLPNINCTTTEELMLSTKQGNEKLLSSINDTWDTNIKKVDLVETQFPTTLTLTTKGVLLGLYNFNFNFNKKLAQSDNEEISFSKRSEEIRSFNFVTKHNKLSFVNNEKINLKDFNNSQVRILINKLKDFIIDTESYALWCATTSEMLDSQFKENTKALEVIKTYFVSKSIDVIVSLEDQAYRDCLQTHLNDINSVIKQLIFTITQPLNYSNNLINNFIIILDSLSNDTPIGDYNLPKVLT